MKYSSFNAYAVLLSFGLFQGVHCQEVPSTIDSCIDKIISLGHWVVCPYCFDRNRLITRFQSAIDKNDTKTIAHVIRRRGLGANTLLLEGELPLTYAAKKAHYESVEQLLNLGADANSQLRGNKFESYPSALIAACITENLPPESVEKTVKILLDYGADPTRNVVMLTETEKAKFEKLRKEFQEDPSKERQVLARIPQDWFRARTALDFAIKHKYLAAANMIRQASVDHRKKGIQTDEQTDGL